MSGHDPQPPPRRDPLFALVDDGLATVVDTEGRHRVRLFALPRLHVYMIIVGTVLVGIPFVVTVGLFPFWDAIGNVLQPVNVRIAPKVHEACAQPTVSPTLRRVLIASSLAFELVLLANFAALASRGVRRQILRVWLCYERTRTFVYLVASAAFFCVVWYILYWNWWVFEHWDSLSSDNSRDPVTRLFLCVIAMAPLATFLFGRMLTVVLAGGWRTASQALRRRRSRQ